MSIPRATRVERLVGRLLKKTGLTLSVAESCTGGLIGDRLTDVPGSSEYFVGGVIAYSNEVKTRVLGVREPTLTKWGAVSEPTVREMAAGVRRKFATQVGVAVSGIAGPGGGTGAKPVGLVYICVTTAERVMVERHLFRGGRRSVKEQSAEAALWLCHRVLGEIS
ncbi:CinA family protein [candidate division WOR-3 bacterium]|uniref:CinA family protein n=1 Tax=candidate division WOR-3 bacterium TaxID=2052148 RepID=A0A938BNY0_UNCW3|nr:CinA family protein [candidate division WOR-3 bacterium]